MKWLRIVLAERLRKGTLTIEIPGLDMQEFKHKPVLLDECLSGLNIRPDGVYVDGTLGGGGHSSEIAKRLTTGTLIGIDRDMDAIRAATARVREATPPGARFEALHGNFHDAKALLKSVGIEKIDGALLDLGVSSYQLDNRARGFSYQGDAPLDMRMDASQPFSARELVNEWPEKDIARVIREYGEENWAAQIARVLCDRRRLAPIETTAQLVDVIDAAIPKKVRARDGSHPARRTFQALRGERRIEAAGAGAGRFRVPAEARRAAVRDRVPLAGGSRGQDHVPPSGAPLHVPAVVSGVRVRQKADGYADHPQADYRFRRGA